MKNVIQPLPFDYICKYPCEKLIYILQQEAIETIAVVLSYIDSDTVAEVFKSLTPSVQTEVIKCISCIDTISSETIKRIEKEIEEKLTQSMYIVSDGAELAVKLLNNINSRNAKQIINQLKNESPELAEQMDERVFNFEDIVFLDSRHVQKILRELDTQYLAIALKSANTEVQNKIFSNMSKRAASMLKEDMEFMGPIRLTDAEEAQEKIIQIIKHLESTGEIVISKHHEEELTNVEVSSKKINHLISLTDILEVSDSFIKKLISILGARFLASVFNGEENEKEIFKKFYSNVPFLKKRSFSKHWNSGEKLINNDEAKECIVSLIKSQTLIENAKKGRIIEAVMKC